MCQSHLGVGILIVRFLCCILNRCNTGVRQKLDAPRQYTGDTRKSRETGHRRRPDTQSPAVGQSALVQKTEAERKYGEHNHFQHSGHGLSLRRRGYERCGKDGGRGKVQDWKSKFSIVI